MKIILVGATGAMGKVLSDLVGQENHEIVAGIAKDKADLSYPIYDNIKDFQGKADVIIDFSNPEAVYEYMAYAVEKNLPVVIATTGYNEEELALIGEATKSIPILRSGNMSLGINLMKNLVKKMTRDLRDFDIEIVEAHHNRKKDAPSGTAMMLLDSVKEEREVGKLSFGRSGREAKRLKNEVGMHSIRAGNIVGEHAVIFAGDDEVLEIKHSAGSRRIFASGAIKAAEYLVGKEPGFYTMDDLFN